MIMSIVPPNPPWKKLEALEQRACLAFYYSDDLARVPVREVTRPQDNKSDPNLETGTFGMFSTCEQRLRTSVVRNKIPFIIFFTSRNGKRVITGYYKVGWYAEGAFGSSGRDYALAASTMRFVDPPLRVEDLPEPARTKAISKFRPWRHLDAEATGQVISMLDQRPNATETYIAEIDRLERFNVRAIGFRCWRRDHPFGWDDARRLIGRSVDVGSVTNRSPTDWWRCETCETPVKAKSLLKECPFCAAVGTLRPADTPTEKAEE